MLRTKLYYLGGLLLIIGAILPIFTHTAGAYFFALGALLFGGLQLSDHYEGDNFVIRRLRRQQMLGALLLIVSAILMLTSLYHIPPFKGGEWKVTLFIAAVLELYVIFRIDHEEKKLIK